MDTKLTLKLNKSVIQKAKAYASEHKTSLSRMIENYLDSITSDNPRKSEITPLVKSLSGIIHLDKDFDYKKEYSDHLSNKYK